MTAPATRDRMCKGLTQLRLGHRDVFLEPQLHRDVVCPGAQGPESGFIQDWGGAPREAMLLICVLYQGALKILLELKVYEESWKATAWMEKTTQLHGHVQHSALHGWLGVGNRHKGSCTLPSGGRAVAEQVVVPVLPARSLRARPGISQVSLHFVAPATPRGRNYHHPQVSSRETGPQR